MVTPAAGGPAEGIGIRPQDAILAIGDKPTDGMSLFEAAALLQVRPPMKTLPLSSQVHTISRRRQRPVVKGLFPLWAGNGVSRLPSTRGVGHGMQTDAHAVRQTLAAYGC